MALEEEEMKWLVEVLEDFYWQKGGCGKHMLGGIITLDCPRLEQ